MSYSYGQKSLAKLNTCHPVLSILAMDVLLQSPIDITLVHGWRNELVQTALFDSGASKKPWPESKHNHMTTGIRTDVVGEVPVPESLALDFAPWVNGAIPWKDTHMFAFLAGIFFGSFNSLKLDGQIPDNFLLRWGGDWDSDGSTTDQTFMDWGHMELILPPS